MKKIFRDFLSLEVFCLIGVLFWINPVFSRVMVGSIYQMDSDVIDFGGNFSTSSSYSLNDTVGGNALGTSTSTSYSLYSGFFQKDATISVSVDTQAVTMSPSLGGLTGGYSNGSVVATVITDNLAGYSLYIKASTSPALQSSGDSFDDYSPSGANPDYDFSVANTDSAFGFSPYGTDIDSRYKNNGSSCGAGSTITSLKCWDGLSTSQRLIAGSGSSNSPTGTNTTINFRAGVGALRAQEEGWYYSTTTITAVAL